MQDGSFRCDANVSVRPVGVQEFGTRTEVKNMNSYRAVFQALNYEVERQCNLLEQGDRVVQETRGWVEDRNITVSQRRKSTPMITDISLSQICRLLSWMQNRWRE
ncbi:MAG: hypothetical protein Ct9H300mP27_05510 [Chloroflexota bacterium]|nr:MAG: hypothetical protein Ct9H300mP27_05510 [Chloroflexota bacterium]